MDCTVTGFASALPPQLLLIETRIKSGDQSNGDGSPWGGDGSIVFRIQVLFSMGVRNLTMNQSE